MRLIKPKAYIVTQGDVLEYEHSVVYNSKNEIIYTTGKYSPGLSRYEAERWCRDNGYRI